MNNFLKRISPTTIICLLLGAWWIINPIQTAFTELADDKVCDYAFSQATTWGYFDHPPMTVLLVRMGTLFDGELGVRFLFTVLQPLYLLMLYCIVKSKQMSHRDVVVFVVICSAMPTMQLYRFIAMPDATLMFFSALFLLLHKRFSERNRALDAVLAGVTIAALEYIKYRGARVVIFTLLANPKISLNQILLPIYIKVRIKAKLQSPTQQALTTMTPGFRSFFTLSSLGGYVQQQWIIPITHFESPCRYGSLRLVTRE